MALRDLLLGVLGLFLGAPERASDTAPERWYSGAEWVLDADGHVLGTSAVLLERAADHGVHVRHVLRQSPSATLPREERVDAPLLALTAAPYRLEAQDVTETVRGGMLALRVVHRDACGHVDRVHVIDATPVSAGEYARRLGLQFPN